MGEYVSWNKLDNDKIRSLYGFNWWLENKELFYLDYSEFNSNSKQYCVKSGVGDTSAE